MKDKNIYRTIENPATGLYRDKGSKFLAFAYPVWNEEQVKEIIGSLKKQYHDARHHCYAYVIGTDKTISRCNDDGEPSNSAGKPILGQIRAKNLNNVLIVVVRYFGGILLGMGGLIKAYKSAAADALNNATVIIPEVIIRFRIKFNYEQINEVMRILKNPGISLITQKYNGGAEIEISIRENISESVISKLKRIKGITMTPLDPG